MLQKSLPSDENYMPSFGKSKRVLVVFGTRPEAIKMAPVFMALQEDDAFDTRLCVTAQHRQMPDSVLEIFEIKPNYDLNIMKPEQSLSDVTAAILKTLDPVISDFKPYMVLVHGDTATTLDSHFKCNIDAFDEGLGGRFESEAFFRCRIDGPCQFVNVGTAVIGDVDFAG